MKKVLSSEEIRAIKEAHVGKELYKGSVVWRDETKMDHTLEFIYRRPSIADMEMMQKQAVHDAMAAACNLFNSLILSSQDDLKVLDDLPAVKDKFLAGEILPFFGSEVQTSSEKL